MKKLKKRMVEIAYKYRNSHLASGLSALPIIKEIYDNFDFKNDIFILSKGHGCLALYAVLESYGFKPDVSKIHPDINLENRISCTTGSLGHGLPMAVGMALAKKIKKEKGIVKVLLGDGECQEGTTWESLLLVEQLKLNNIGIYIDNNRYQALEKTVSPVVEMIKKLGLNSVTIKSTTKGYGLKLFEGHPDWHVHNLTEEEYKKSMEELK